MDNRNIDQLRAMVDVRWQASMDTEVHIDTPNQYIHGQAWEAFIESRDQFVRRVRYTIDGNIDSYID